MKVNKAFYLQFGANTSSSQFINVNFPVKSIHIKSAVFCNSVAVPAGNEQYLTLISDLTNGEPLAHLYTDIRKTSANQFCDISFQPYKPETINGTYTFELKNSAGAQYSTALGDFVNLIMEFNGVDTRDT